ncbi:class I mannose-6-phosphate isomerase [Spirochaetia bacterium]|nr:class I mannose-6-phosphate isomerase [Spirochaetia bacterium]
MIILQPFPHQTIWGGDKLKKYCKIPSRNIGHLYSVKGTIKESNIILNGKYKGESFYSYFIENKNKFGLSNLDYYPLTIALVDAKNDLSIQVHPDASAAFEFEGISCGKNESFYIIESPEKGFIYSGCLCDTKDILRNCLNERVYDTIWRKLSVKEGDYIFIKEGMLHSLTAGTLAYEIEETCDYTYRLYDFDRKDGNGNQRPLDIDKAIKSIDLKAESKARQYNKNEIVEGKYATKLIHNVPHYKNITNQLECLTILDGGGYLDTVEIVPGMTIILEPGNSIAGLNVKKAIVARNI